MTVTALLIKDGTTFVNERGTILKVGSRPWRLLRKIRDGQKINPKDGALPFLVSNLFVEVKDGAIRIKGGHAR